MKQMLNVSHPNIAAEWHPTKNNGLTPSDVTRGSDKIVSWKCPGGDDHEWETSISKRTQSKATKCPICSNKKVVLSNCLMTTHPEISQEWHPTKNGQLTPYDLTAGANKTVYWQCIKDPSHEWQAKIADRTKKNGTNCPWCANRKVSESNSLAVTHPHLAAEWHPTKNGKLTPYDVVAGANKTVHWICLKNPSHEWPTQVAKRTNKKGTNCPYCANRKVSESNSLAVTHPHLAAEWHPTKNAKKPEEVTAGSGIEVRWQCLEDGEHVWQTRVVERTASNSKCPYCSKRKVIVSNSLAITHPDIAAQWHPTKNTKTPYEVTAINNGKAWWKCSLGHDHEWEAPIEYRINRDAGCPVCINRKVVESNCLTQTHPAIAREWHPTKNGKLTASSITAGYSNKVWWICAQNNEHEWLAKVYDRTKLNKGKCPFCRSSWTIEKIKFFVKSLLLHIDNLTPAELYVIFQQNGLLTNQSKAKDFTDILKTGKLPKAELEKFIDGKSSIIDNLITDNKNAEQLIAPNERLEVLEENFTIDESEALPIVETNDVLKSLSCDLMSNVDTEAVEFFINSAIAKIWKHIFSNEETALKQLHSHTTGIYALSVKERFLIEYNGAKNLQIPCGYQFSIDGKLCLPNLMQRYTAYLVESKKRVGNWSGTGAGKTLSAVLSSRVIDAKITIICCPNSVVLRWEKGITEIYPDSNIFSKKLDISFSSHKSQYILLNYEFFQQPKAEASLKRFLEKHVVDFVVVDEIHHSKQRVVENISKRKKVISALLSEAYQKNKALCVLGMSATPVINNLFEGKTLIELITGVHHVDLNTHPTIPNCIALYQKIVTHGIRWIPQYNQKLNLRTIGVDCSNWLEEIKKLGIRSTMVELESILTHAKIPEILSHIKPKTIIYTHYLKNIIVPLQKAVEEAGWRVGLYSGNNKFGLDSFMFGKTEVLIATSCISTGIDGLQSVCNRIIVNTLPWTHAEFEQLKGRVYRQGQIQDHVDIIVPLTYAEINGERWSWCESRWKRIQFKKSIADAAIDGVIPEGHLRTPEQAYADIIRWFNRLDTGKMQEIQRERIQLSLSDQELSNGFKRFGDFSQMNRLMNVTSSEEMHKKFQNNPHRWEYYHALYREARTDWNVIPYEEAIKWCKARPYYVVGDFGCGEAFLAEFLDNTVYSFDHVAINDKVIACDMAHVPLEDASLDAAIFSLSLMGSNYIDYIKEAHRCLKLDGWLWIAESTTRFENLADLSEQIRQIGFDRISIQKKGDFTFFSAIKTDEYYV